MPWFVKPAVFTACLFPFLLLCFYGFSDIWLASSYLGANPIEEITHFTGDWTLYCLLITLSVTPARRYTGYHPLIKLRRMLGLFAFFYACLHISTYFVLDQFFDWQEITADIIKRPYITLGFSAYVLLIPLALTSTQRMVRRLGKRWRQLHKLVYIVTTLGILHFLWLVKADIIEPVFFGILFIILMASRLHYLKI